MAKRVRGYKLDIELAEAGQAKRPALSSQQEQQTRSALANGLLALWSHGKLSATMLQWLAHLAIMDGAGHPELANMAKVGACGNRPGNCHRDLMVQFCKDVHVCEETIVEVPLLDPKSSQKEIGQASLLLPHLMFASLACYDMFENLVQSNACETFWDNVENAKMTGSRSIQ